MRAYAIIHPLHLELETAMLIIVRCSIFRVDSMQPLEAESMATHMPKTCISTTVHNRVTP